MCREGGLSSFRMGLGLAVVMEVGGVRANTPIFNSFVEKRGGRAGRINIHAGLRLLPKKRADEARATNVGWGGDVRSYVSTGMRK